MKYLKDNTIALPKSKLAFGTEYSRNDLRDILNLKHPKREYWSGITGFKNRVVLWVTLDKSKSEYKYNDRFEAKLFHHESQKGNNSVSHPSLNKIVNGHQPLLFCRIKEHSKFIFLGSLKPKSFDDTVKPMQFIYEAVNLPPKPSRKVQEIISWRPKRKVVFKQMKKKKPIKDPKLRGRKANEIITKAEIYKTEFEVEGNKYVYVGQDSKCEADYFGSSTIIFHYGNVFGKKIFKKTILDKRKNIVLSSLNTLESKYINQEKIKAKKSGIFSINHTGENRRLLTLPNTKTMRKKIISEAKKIDLSLKVHSANRGVLMPFPPPYPFNQVGMHVQSNYSLNSLGFAFRKNKATNKNIGLARQVLRDLRLESFDSESSGYVLIMARHGLSNPKQFASLFKEVINTSYDYFK